MQYLASPFVGALRQNETGYYLTMPSRPIEVVQIEAIRPHTQAGRVGFKYLNDDYLLNAKLADVDATDL